MRRMRSKIDCSELIIEAGLSAPGDMTLVERKGWGHPDTLADHLAEQISRVYSRYTRDHFGAVLHHNFDKLALLGGRSEVRYGAGQMINPVRVLVNGRAARQFAGTPIPVEELARETVEQFFADRLSDLIGEVNIELNITSNPSPGAVLTGVRPSDRALWFAPRSLDDLRERRVTLANDTSFGTGWAPERPAESFVRELVDHFSAPSSSFRAEHAWCGSDVKLMGFATADEVDVILCVPQKSCHVPSRDAYLANKELVVAECARLARERLGHIPARFGLNVRDLPDRDELYLTYTGSSIESGDEGVVGRGNRVSGLITPLRPMNVEGANGKNPVYHVGKLYNLAAHRLARRLFEATGDYAEVHLVSATGQRLDRPWRVLVRLTATEPPLDKVNDLIVEALDEFPDLTEEILADGVVLC